MRNLLLTTILSLPFLLASCGGAAATGGPRGEDPQEAALRAQIAEARAAAEEQERRLSELRREKAELEAQIEAQLEDQDPQTSPPPPAGTTP